MASAMKWARWKCCLLYTSRCVSATVVQLSFQRLAPEYLTLYPLAALPIAFLVTACIGMALERTVIRHLYGRPLETLLATWGISLILIQLVRVTFGAQNVEVANPASASYTPLPSHRVSHVRLLQPVPEGCRPGS